MILGILLLLGGVVCLVMAQRSLRALHDPNWLRGEATSLVIGPMRGQDEPRILLRRGERVPFGPYWATWDPPAGMPGVAAPVTASGRYRVSAAVDLSGEDALSTGDTRLAGMLRSALGPQALLLLPEDGGRPVLLHGTMRGARGSAGGIGIEQAHLDELMAMLGDPAGLRVEVVRRRVQRAGWGGAQAQRHRGRQ